MTRTYSQIQKEIEKLQRQAEVLRRAEIKGVVERIKAAVAHYGLTADQLGVGKQGNGSRAPGKTTGTIAGSDAKFSDGQGNRWSGRGPRPRWLRDALASGRSMEEFRTGAPGTPAAAGSLAKAAGARKTKRAPSKVRYSDDAGHSWTGRGPKPGWLKAALDQGKSLEDFLK